MKITQHLGTWIVLLCSASAFAGHHEGGHVGGSAEIGALTVEQKIGLAKAAAPSNVSDEARILDADNTVLQDGDNGWTCMVGTPPNYENPMCVDAVWLGWLDAYMNKTPYKNETTAIGFSYMLVGDIPSTMTIPSTRRGQKYLGARRPASDVAGTSRLVR